jgi:hypothetical protein
MSSKLLKGKFMKQSWLKVLFGLILAATLSAPAWGANPAQPGTINYVEGQAFIGSQPLNSSSIGTAELLAGQKLSTTNGRVEVLLTPGIFLRLDDNSSATMVWPGLTNTNIRLTKGRATIEVDEIHKQNNLRLEVGNVTTTLRKTGFYSFDATPGKVQVLKGEAFVHEGTRKVKVSNDHMLTFANFKAKPKKLDKNAYTANDFYQWSSLRSKYLAEANADAAQTYASGYWPGTGWYWDPWFSSYTFIPSYGVLYSPFGWGYYSPLLFYESPFYGQGPYYHHFDPGFGFRQRGPLLGEIDHDRAPLIRSHTSPSISNHGFRSGGFRNGGFRGGELHAGGFRGGGFRGGELHAGGFRGGGFRGGELHAGGFRGNPGFSGGAFHGDGGFQEGGEAHNGGEIHGR